MDLTSWELIAGDTGKVFIHAKKEKLNIGILPLGSSILRLFIFLNSVDCPI